MLKSLNIQNYRLFKNFSLDHIAPVNLIVGTNNSGKSSLLEAIFLLTSEDASTNLAYVLNERGEFVSRPRDLRYNRRFTEGYQVSHIFYGHIFEKGQAATIQSNSGNNSSLTISLRELKALAEGEGRQGSLFEDEDLGPQSRSMELVIEFKGAPGTPREENLRVTDDGLLSSRIYSPLTMTADQIARLITTNYLAYDELAVLWDRITLTPREDRVIEALRILEPRVDRISFTSRQTSNSGILLKMRGEDEPIPLGSMGDGMRRILTIIASLVTVENGTLLVDEIDTGLYYAVLRDMWRLILETSSRINTQVFATTHSWDCVRAFQEALADFPESNAGQLIRLDREADEIQPILYSPKELNIAIQQDIEVR